MTRPTLELMGRQYLRFGLFEFNFEMGELRKQGLKVKLGPHASKVLALLLKHPGHLLKREEIQQQLWGGNTFVDFEQSINKVMHQVRQALGDTANSPRFIETVAGIGYRFIPWLEEPRRPPRKPVRKLGSIAVLPFSSEPANPEMEVLNKAIVESIIDQVSRTPGLRILAYKTVAHYRDEHLNPQTVAQNLAVRVVAVGELTKLNDEFLLHMELIDAGDGTQLWGGRFKELNADVLADPEKLALRICDQLRPILVRSDKQKRKDLSM